MLLSVLTACNIESPYIKTGTRLTFKTSDVMGTQMMVSAHPEDDRSYYYFDILEKSKYDSMKLNDEHFMAIMLDSLYRYYLDWRSSYLWTNEPYIAEFRSFAFYYGDAQRYFISLTPNTDYVIFGMNINPDDIQYPVGHLYKQYVRTGDVDYKVSETVFDFAVKMYDKPTMFGGGECLLNATIRPSKEGHLSREPYLALMISDKDMGNEELPYELRLTQYIREYAEMVQWAIAQNPQSADRFLKKDITYLSIFNYGAIEPGEWVTVIATAYRISWPKALYVRHFQYQPGTELPYAHDEKTDYSEYFVK